VKDAHSLRRSLEDPGEAREKRIGVSGQGVSASLERDHEGGYNADPPTRPHADTILLGVVKLIDHPQHSLSDFANLARCQEREVQEFHQQ
jgi:hypothetical protein